MGALAQPCEVASAKWPGQQATNAIVTNRLGHKVVTLVILWPFVSCPCEGVGHLDLVYRCPFCTIFGKTSHPTGLATYRLVKDDIPFHLGDF